MLLSMIYNIGSQDEYTGNHIKRTQEFISILAMNLSSIKRYKDIPNLGYISNLIKSAPLYDIGKIAIPDSILLKPARLNDEELIIMKTHTEKGLMILNKVKKYLKEDNKFFSITSDVIKYHHEKWDGSGYPYGLEGEEIPLSSRLIALIDVYDALTSERPYKKVFKHEEAVSLILKARGTHFDPQIVHIFENSLKEFESIALLYNDFEKINQI